MIGTAPLTAIAVAALAVIAPDGVAQPVAPSIGLVVESGTARLSQWLLYQRDVVADYRAAFGEDPPSSTGVAIMSDADTTRGSALAWYGDITLAPR